MEQPIYPHSSDRKPITTDRSRKARDIVLSINNMMAIKSLNIYAGNKRIELFFHGDIVTNVGRLDNIEAREIDKITMELDDSVARQIDTENVEEEEELPNPELGIDSFGDVVLQKSFYNAEGQYVRRTNQNNSHQLIFTNLRNKIKFNEIDLFPTFYMPTFEITIKTNRVLNASLL